MRRTPSTLLLALGVLAVLGAPVALSAQEVQVPMDESGRITEVDRDLARRLGLFLDEYPDLQVARLYELGPDSYVLELTRSRDGRTFRERVPLDGEGARALRARITTESTGWTWSLWEATIELPAGDYVLVVTDETAARDEWSTSGGWPCGSQAPANSKPCG